MPEDTTNLSRELVYVVRCALMGGAEVTMNDLVKYASHRNGIIAQINYCIDVFEQFELELIPPAEEGDLNQVRIVRPKGLVQLNAEEIKAVSTNGESQTVEFKSSLWFDRARAQNDANATADQLKSSRVLHSSLKTIAAFMNSDGGMLFIGIADDGTTCGINDDFLCLGCDHADTDSWELQLRSAVDSLFHEGSRVNDYIRILFCEHNNNIVAKVQVQPRNALTFLKLDKTSDFYLYRRQGNRTLQVPIFEIENFIEERRTSRL